MQIHLNLIHSQDGLAGNVSGMNLKGIIHEFLHIFKFDCDVK